MMKIFNSKCVNFFCTLSLLFFFGCKKDFLEKRPSTNIVVPSTLSDLMQLLDNNEAFKNKTPALGFLSADEYYYPSFAAFNAAETKTERNCFTWNSDIYGGETKIADWNGPYQSVFYANVVLEQWAKLSEEVKSSSHGKFVKAWALFARSFAFYNLAQIFSPAYNSATADKDLGIPLKLTANINDIVQRSSVRITYERILTDLESSVDLYPNSFPEKNLNRPSKAAVYALLARIYLSMRDYPDALLNANHSLDFRNQLNDFNTLDNSTSSNLDKFNKEIIQANLTNTSFSTVILEFGSATINPELINLYEINDLRKEIYFLNNGGNYKMRRSRIGPLYELFTLLNKVLNSIFF
jgi:hypothetical protein